MLKKIDYEKRKQIKYLFAFGLEALSLLWFIFGNFIFWEWRGKTPEDDEDY